MTHRRKHKESARHQLDQDYWRELEELQQLSSTLLNDLMKLRLEPSISSSTRNMRKIDRIIGKAEEQIEVLRKWHARQHARHRSKHTPAPWPDSDKKKRLIQFTINRCSRELLARQASPVWLQAGDLLRQAFTTEVLDVIDRGQELHLPIQKKPSKHQHESWCHRSHSHVIPTIEHWQDQLISLRNTKSSRPDHVKMVEHFRNLFDVPTEEGVYARMNDVYIRLAEMQNVYRSLKGVLRLNDDAPISSVLNGVNRLCELHSGTTAQLLSELMQEERLDRLITKLEHYHKFYPVFDAMARELVQVLDVSSMSQVVPAVRALKLLNP
ncbi:uncharacterized protein [Amphiura filiformis]|uniref:uncharacterized protein n=1 Tax=Amphiura filiformis TaxID=82378 RepID=UPI003B228F14